MDIEHVRSRFIKHFDGTTGFIYASPGRINALSKYRDNDIYRVPLRDVLT